MKDFFFKMLAKIVLDVAFFMSVLATLLLIAILPNASWVLMGIVFLGTNLILKFVIAIWQKVAQLRYNSNRKKDLWHAYQNLHQDERYIIDSLFLEGISCTSFEVLPVIRSLMSKKMLLPALNQPPQPVVGFEMNLQLRMHPYIWQRLQKNATKPTD